MKTLLRTTAALVAAAVMTSVIQLGAHAATDPPTLIGHRGVGESWAGRLGIPEQSIPAIEWAAAHHADIVEGDVQVSGPDSAGRRTMYMMHDTTLDRTTNGTGDSNTRSWSYISARWLEIPVDSNGNGDPDNTIFHPPSFRSWLRAAKETGKLVFVQFRGSYWTKAQIKRYADEIAAQGMTSRVITAGSETRLNYFRAYSTGKRSFAASQLPSVTKVKSLVGSSGYATMALSVAEKNRGYIETLQDEGIKVLVWTLENEVHYARALPLEVDGWMCDNTQDAWEWLQDPENGAA
jgi:glycerophosphoryl diester phosphodiesterase